VAFDRRHCSGHRHEARYRGAFNTLDSAAARGVWPTVDERALEAVDAR
jgi:hypothetical protein